MGRLFGKYENMLMMSPRGIRLQVAYLALT